MAFFVKRKSNDKSFNSDKQLTHEEVTWCEGAMQRNMSIDDVRKLLDTSGKISVDKKNAMLLFYGNLLLNKHNPDAEEHFKNQVKMFYSNKKELSFSERRQVKKWIKEVKKAGDLIDKALKSANGIVIYEKEHKDEEIEALRLQIIEVVMSLDQLFILTHPISGEEIGRKELEKMEGDLLIKVLENCRNDIKDLVEGKI